MLPPKFQHWFAARGWQPRAHQLALVDHAAQGRKRAAGGAHRRRQDPGRLPAQPDRAWRSKAARERASRKRGLHTLYISPLKALAVDVARNLEAPIAEMDLPVTVETRTGDTPAARRQRQRHAPPDILLTTPEQLALLLAHPRAAQLFENLQHRGAGRIACPVQFQARRSAGAGAGAACRPWRPAIAASAFRPR